MDVLATPGHTLDSACFVLLEGGEKVAVFTGDTMFVGSVGRPDLAANAEVGKEKMSGLLFASLKKLTSVLPGEVVVLPGHGSGSLCGSGMSCTLTFSTILA
jgi:hydroxyacylglutathione hydrolase